MTEYFGLLTTVGSDGAARRERRGGIPTVLWKSGRRSSGGMMGGATDAVDRKVLVDAWLAERFRGLLMKAPGYADREISIGRQA